MIKDVSYNVIGRKASRDLACIYTYNKRRNAIYSCEIHRNIWRSGGMKHDRLLLKNADVSLYPSWQLDLRIRRYLNGLL